MAAILHIRRNETRAESRPEPTPPESEKRKIAPKSYISLIVGDIGSGMKTFHQYLRAVTIVIGICVLLGCQTNSTSPSATGAAAPDPNAGSLTISRAPNLAELLVVTIDAGKPNIVRTG